MADIFDMADTWNDAETTFTAIKMDVTNTASAAGSLLLDLKVGGASKFKIGAVLGSRFDHVGSEGPYVQAFSFASNGISKTWMAADGSWWFRFNNPAIWAEIGGVSGAHLVVRGHTPDSPVVTTFNSPWIQELSSCDGFIFAITKETGGGQAEVMQITNRQNTPMVLFPHGIQIGDTTTDLRAVAAGQLGIYNGGGSRITFNNTGVSGILLSSAYSFGWSSGAAADAGNGDLYLVRDAADVLAQRRSTNAQAFRLYNTYTNASNYERGFLKWAANDFEIGTDRAGTGSTRRTSLTDAAILMKNIPTSDPLVAGQVWSNGGVLTLSAG